MKDFIKTNSHQIHLTLEQKILIETDLTKKSISEIARSIGKDFSIISKKVHRCIVVKEHNNISFTPIPCIHRKSCKLKIYAKQVQLLIQKLQYLVLTLQ